MKRLIVDIDNTICSTVDGDYENSVPDLEFLDRLRSYQKDGFEIVLFTSRNMRTFDGNIGKINKHTLPVLTTWLKVNAVPYDEIIVGKPWCGKEGFYIDDRAIRPDEFKRLTRAEIDSIIRSEG